MAPPDDSATKSAVDTQHPWLGLDSFTEETQAYFYGRDEEVAELGRRVQRKLLTILFGQSGLGKTSILRAGIVPRLRPMGYCPVYVRIDYSADSPPPSEQIKGAIFRATQASGQWTQTGAAVAGESLWEFLHHRDDVLRDASGKTLIPLLIFDQFEEIFTLAQTDESGRKRAAEFIADLADLVENRPPKAVEARIEHDDSAAERFDFARGDYRILIALREDYLAHLEGVKGVMPSVTQNRMRLARMTGVQALAAVVNPGGKLVSQEVAESIVRFIAGGSELPNAEVEPSLLSLICRELNNARIAQGRNEISADLLAGSRDTILSEFYERALSGEPAGVRTFIEDDMLTESGFRESLAEERVLKGFAAAGAPADTLAKLVNRRLLRIEERLDARRVELTHDVLCPVVRASRDVRLEREARDDAERKLEAQRAREIATRKALVRARKIAAAAAALAVVALGGTIFGYISTKRAQEAEAKAEQTRLMAEQARGEAEKLVVFLLEDFYLELEPVGRLDIVAALSKRALDYYSALPPELRTAETDRNRALALVRYGIVQRQQSNLDESEKALSEGVGVLTKLRESGDRTESTIIGLGLGLTGQARVLDSRNKRPESLVAARQAVDILQPLASSASPSVSARRTIGFANLYLGFSQQRNNEEEAAVRSLETARNAYRSIDGLKLDDLPSAVAYAEASAWEVDALRALGRIDEARRVTAEATRVAGQVLERRPSHMGALRARALLQGALANAEWNELHVEKALDLFRQSAADYEALVKLDPGNQISWNNLADTRGGVGFSLNTLGRVGESMQQLKASLAVESNAKKSAAFISLPLGLAAGYLAMFAADAGDRAAAQAALAANRRLVESSTKDLASDAFSRAMGSEFLIYYGYPSTGFGYGAYAIPYADGNFEVVREMARASIDRVEKMKPPDAKQALDRDRLLDMAFRVQADASLRLGNPSAAETAITRALETSKGFPKRTLSEERDAALRSAQAAMIAARLGQHAKAEQLIGPPLEFQRKLHLRGKDNDDQGQRVEYALTLYASALASPAKASGALKEAATILDGLPHEMRRLVSVTRLRNDIAEEQRKQR